jgi:uncharacterized spore protein YtfJ
MAKKSEPLAGYGIERATTSVEDTVERFLETADVRRVFGEPVRSGDTTLLPAAESVTGFGFGIGAGADGDAGEDAEHHGGGGGGGGGYTQSRSVAVVVAGPDGVRVQPVFDVTKVALAALTAGGFVLATLFGIRRFRHKIDALGDALER